MPKYNLHVMLTVYFNKRIELCKVNANNQTNQVFNFDKFINFEKDIDLKQRAWIEVKGKAIEANVRQLRS